MQIFGKNYFTTFLPLMMKMPLVALLTPVFATFEF
jgi:hypothetical protein